MEGKGETRLRNEQASENKVEARSRTSKKGRKTKYYFSRDFSKTCGGFQTPTGRAGFVQSPRCAPLSVAGLPVLPDSARPGLCFFVRSICQEGRGAVRGYSVQERGGKTK